MIKLAHLCGKPRANNICFTKGHSILLLALYLSSFIALQAILHFFFFFQEMHDFMDYKIIISDKPIWNKGAFRVIYNRAQDSSHVISSNSHTITL